MAVTTARSAPRVVFLDLDGCLVDSRAAISRCLNIGLDAVGAPQRHEAELHPLIGPPLHDAYLSLLAAAGMDARLAERCVESYRAAYAEVSLTDTVAVEGIAAPLHRLAEVSTLAVVTSKPAAFAEPILEVVGLRGCFVAVHAPSLEARSEPKAHTLARALADVAGGDARGTTMVGDRHHDVDAGLACGTWTVGVTWGIGDAEELAHADRLVHEPGRLAEVLGDPQ